MTSTSLTDRRGVALPEKAAAICFVVMVALFLFAWPNLQKPMGVFDERAHVGYVAQIQRDGTLWPDLRTLRMVDAQTFRATAESNPANHPSFYYAALALLGPQLDGMPSALPWYRAANLTLALLGLLAWLGFALKASLADNEFLCVTLFVVTIPVLAPVASVVNNDNLAFLGGGLTLLGWQAFVSSRKTTWLLCACLGVLLASAAKLTGLLLAGGFLGGVMLLQVMRRQASLSSLAIVATTFAICAIPFAVLTVTYGSPTPNTEGQLALLHDTATKEGWDKMTRMGFVPYVGFFLKNLLADWMPLSDGQPIARVAALLLTAAMSALALAGIAAAGWRVVMRRASTFDEMVLAGGVAIGAMLMLHIGFSYQRHVATGWLSDAFPRYYLPLLGIVPLAALALARSLPEPMRGGVVGVMIAAPLVLCALGVLT
jgi:hypothetical protein